MILKDALENAIGESMASDGSEVQVTVPDVDAAIRLLETSHGADGKACKPDGYEVWGSEDAVSWALLLKGKP